MKNEFKSSVTNIIPLSQDAFVHKCNDFVLYNMGNNALVY